LAEIEKLRQPASDAAANDATGGEGGAA
jgi:hypothetical protein